MLSKLLRPQHASIMQSKQDIYHAAQLLVAAQSVWDPTWGVAVELCVHVQARAFGFQVVNASQEDTQKGQCTPATSAVAADHLIHLLKDRAAVIAAETPGQKHSDVDYVFKESIASLHAAYFAQGPYMSWKNKSAVKVLDKQLNRFIQSRSLKVGGSVAAAMGRGNGNNAAGFTGVSDAPEWVQQLAQLALYFLLWTEAANARHTPELLWLLYHMMMSSSNFNKACAVLGSTDQSHYSLLRWLPATGKGRSSTRGSSAGPAASNRLPVTVQLSELSSKDLQGLEDDLECYEAVRRRGFVRGVLLPVRNALGDAARVGAVLQEGPGPYNAGVTQGNGSLHESSWWDDFPNNELAARQVLGLNTIKSQPGVSPGLGSPVESWSLAELVLQDILFFGDGCIFLDMVIQPVFNLMAEQIGLMGDMGESPALRLGYDDFNESACMPQVLSALVQELSGEHFVDPWDGLLKRFVTSHAAVESLWSQSSYLATTFKPATPQMQQRYPRDPRRLEELAAKLRDAGAGGVEGNAVFRSDFYSQQQRRSSGGQQLADGEAEWVAPSPGGSMPVVHIPASLRVTDSLWARLLKKSFIETRSIGAVAVAFSRVYILHAILMIWMSLLAYRIPELSLTGGKSVFTGGFWREHGMTFADCISWGVFLHAVLHVVKDVLILQLLSTPSAIRYQLDTSAKDDQPPAPVGFAARMRLWSAKHSSAHQDDRIEQVVQPPVHGGGVLKMHNIVTLLFWLACCVVLLDSHVPSWPLNKLLTKMLSAGRPEPVMPVWALISLIYVGMWALHWLSGAIADSLPSSMAGLTAVARKDSSRAAEHFFPYGAMTGSQNWGRFVVNALLWLLVLAGKVLFDFFVVLQPLGKGPVAKLLQPLDASLPWTRWAEAVIAVLALWLAAAFLVFYDTGLFWQLVSAVYSTLILGMQRRIGHVKSWYDLVWAFPHLSYKFNQRMIPSASQLTWQLPPSNGGAPAGKDAAAAADEFPTDDTAAGGASAAAPVKVLQWVPISSPAEVVFHQAWNQIVDDLRSRDLLSNAEAGNLKYMQLGWGQGRTTAWLLMPKFVAAGAAVEAVGQRGLTSKTQSEVIARAFNWLVWLLAALNMLQEEEVKVLLLAASSSEVGPKGQGPHDPSSDDRLTAAKALTKSRELLDVLAGKLAATQVPFCLLASKEDHTKLDVNTQMLLSETLGSVAALARPKFSKDTVAAIKARPHRLDLTHPAADPCLDLFGLQQRDQELLDAAQAAAARVKEASREGPEAQAAAEAAAAEAQQQVQVEVLEPRMRRRQLCTQVVGWLLDMLKSTRGEAVPKSGEAVRALTFFATSLSNPYMPSAQPVALSRSMTTLTPHYGEGVIYALSEQAANTDMGANCGGGDDDLVLLNAQEEPTETLNYLRIVYAREWRNCQERLFSRADVRRVLAKATKHGSPTAADIREASFLPGQALHPWRHELLAWASMRGQLLLRTVHGMMYYETALQQLILMQSRAQLTKLARQMMTTEGGSLRQQHLPDGWADQVAEAAALLLAREKYSYVVSSQVLGEMQLGGKVVQRWLAHSIRSVLSKKYPSLRIAYIDLENLGELLPAAAAQGASAQHAVAARPGQVSMAGPRNRGRGGKAHRLLRQYSVLLQYDEQHDGVVELYRVRLPLNLETDRGVILGEGKPENQNHAIIFCHTEAVQTIDCNQDGFLVEALKLPNLLAEFELQDGRRINVRGSLAQQQQLYAGWWAKLTGAGTPQGPALLGFREWVFSEDSGALAEFAAATERSFGTTMQRVMHNPGGCRFHYGHPDIWDKLFTMTNGGVSKSTKSLHVSEDVFGGYNVMLRGRDVAYVDYIAVGKGRDMGFETINMFEAKIAAGNGEQVVSRDVPRLARRMNMPRLLSWYFTGNGFFINTALLMTSMLVNAWLCLLLQLLVGVRSSNSTVLADSLAVVGGLQILQLGSLSLLVYVATVWLEDGFFTTIKNVLKQFVAGSMFFYVFRGQTSANAFSSDLKYGGAAYAATGRGYKLKATPFLEVFMRYGRTHMWFGGHLLVLLIMAVSLGLKTSLLVAWANILAIMSLLAAPFWFNPFSLDWQKNKEAAREWMDWMAGHKPANSGHGKKLWRQFNDEQLQKAADDAQRQLGRTSSNIFSLVYMIPNAIIVGVAVYGMLEAWWAGIAVILGVNLVVGVITACWHMATHLEAVKNAAVTSRSVKFVLKFVIAAATILLFAFMVDPGTRKKINVFHIVVRVLLVEFELAQISGRVLIAFSPQWQPARRIVNNMCWLADFALGMVVLLLLFIGSLFGLLTRYQAAVLFSMGYAAHYLAEEGLKHSEVGRLAKELKDLQRQERSDERAAAADKDTRPPPPPGGSSTTATAPQPWAAGLFSAAATGAGPSGTPRPTPSPSVSQSAATAAATGANDRSSLSSGPVASDAAAASLASVRAFLANQQRQGSGSSALSSLDSSSTQPPAQGTSRAARGGPAGWDSAAGAAAGVGRVAAPAAVGAAAALDGSRDGTLAARVAAPTEEELARWNATSPPAAEERLQRVFQRSDTLWTDVDVEDDHDAFAAEQQHELMLQQEQEQQQQEQQQGQQQGQQQQQQEQQQQDDYVDMVAGGLPEDLLREASAAGAAAAARASSTGGAADAAASALGPRPPKWH